MRQKRIALLLIFSVLLIAALIIPLLLGQNRYGDSYRMEGIIEQVEKKDNGYLLYVNHRDFYNSDAHILIYISETEIKMRSDILQKTQIRLDGFSSLQENLVGSQISANCMGPRTDVLNGHTVFLVMDASIHRIAP